MKKGPTVWLWACCFAGATAFAATAQKPVHVFCGTGDHWWSPEKDPVDSPATIAGMFEWMKATYQVDCIYWRGGQSEIWNEVYNQAPEIPLTYEANDTWSRHLIDDLGVNDAAARAARAQGMKLILYTGLFENGLQPDVGVVCPYPFEDRLRSEHPEWCSLDRWGERRAPGPMSFAYAEMRAIMVKRYMDAVMRHDYAGIAFYTYTENVGIRYLDEFGFNEPVVTEFNRRYPDVSLRKGALTKEQKEYWYECQGRFVTEFLRELHTALKSKGKTLTLILDAKQPDYPQAWWGKPIPGAGHTRMEWQRWIKEGLVDEFWVQLAAVTDQQHLLDRLLVATRGTSIKLTARVTNPFTDVSWKKYNDAGVVLTTCITSPVNDIERVTLAPTSPSTISSADWPLRVQTLADMASGLVKPDMKQIASRARDPHPLVRRKALQALGELKAIDQVGVIEAGLEDPEHSVRLAAVKALVVVHGPNSSTALLKAMELNPSFILKLAAIEALGAMGSSAEPTALEGLKSKYAPVREVCVRALRPLSRMKATDTNFAALRAHLLAPDAAVVERYWAADSLSKLQAVLTVQQRDTVLTDFAGILRTKSPATVQLRTATALGSLARLLSPAEKQIAVDALSELFRQYGTGCERSDAAFGWRVAGNALLELGQTGSDMLESFRKQKADQWLAWFAYEVVFAPERGRTMVPTTEEDAVAVHAKFAPPFPGWRTWTGKPAASAR